MIEEKIEVICKEGSLNGGELETVRELALEYSEKIKRMIKNFESIELHVKVYEKSSDGKIDFNKKNKKFSINSRVYSAVIFKAEDVDWDLARAVHKVMKKILNEIEHRFHVSDKHLKLHSPQKVRKRGR